MNIKKKQRGFTLIEIIIAFALFAIMMGGIYGIILLAMNNNKAGEVKQKAALYGQEVFEDIKSGSINKIDNEMYDISGINLKEDSSSIFKGKKTFKDGYEAEITMERNTSITLNHSNDNIKFHDFNITVSGENGLIRLKSDDKEKSLHYNTESDDSLKIIVNTKTKDKIKQVEIKDEKNNKLLTLYHEIGKDKENYQIRLFLDLKDYRAINKDSSLKKIIIDVYNEDDIPLNIILKNSSKVNVSVNGNLGKVQGYDINSELYNITVEIKNKNIKRDEKLFTGYSTQNVRFN
ncbi:type IV pilus modification PilV family protein [Clostridium weizhouense]|uniref:Prepilin-type N-terminal cleavage/methylation domain-containing protein n=1 Tax=Clostridium weizhouense TaxID=2859781 RepID=A0ABS7ANG0_9CLOT|nr:prepilin-type N-terminal cleavage/methylation domain-containing protein [Clostridium weizhouense]MBW6410207.1 prepilin-type N-terminal cleavage/methylation domain-containing protein [Clostridium weizhouense]